MTRIDAAREAAGKTREQLVPYAASARDAAAHYTDEAWQRQSNPDWLVEPPVTPLPLRTTPATGPASGSSASGALPLDPEVEAKQADTEADEDEYDVEAAIEAEIEAREQLADEDRPEDDGRS